MEQAMQQEQHSIARQIKRGFTLVEIMIAIFIIGIVLGGAFVGIRRYIEDAKYSATQSRLRYLQTRIMTYESRLNQYPTTLQDLVRKPQGDGFDAWEQFASADELLDGWKNKFIYRVTPGEKNPYELYAKSPGGAKISAWK